MKALLDASAWNLESGKVLARENRLPTMAETDDCFAFHGVTSRPRLVFFVGQLVPDRFQVLVGLLQAGARLVDGSEDGNVVDSDADFRLMFPQEFLNEDDLFSQVSCGESSVKGSICLTRSFQAALRTMETLCCRSCPYKKQR